MAAPAHQLQIIPVQGHSGIIDVVRGQVDFVVYDLASGNLVLPQALLAQPAHAGSVRLTAALPRFAFVKSLCKIFHGLASIDGAQLPTTAAYWVGWKGPRLAMLPRTEDDATMTYVYSTAPPGYSP